MLFQKLNDVDLDGEPTIGMSRPENVSETLTFKPMTFKTVCGPTVGKNL